MKLLRASLLAAIATIPTLGHGDPHLTKAHSFQCSDIEAVKVDGVPGCSFYQHYRDSIFDPKLPIQLGLPDDSDRSWIITVLGLTLFTEARMENELSLAAVAPSILNRVGFGKPGFNIQNIVHAAANNAYSQWILTSQIKDGKRVAWIETQVRSDPHNKPEDFDRNLEVERNANALLLEDPVRYAYASSNKKYPRLLTRSMELAQCIVRSAAASPASLPPDLAWTKDFGTEFVNPDKVKQDKEGDTNGPCHHHSAYMSGTGLAYCPQSTGTQGVCTAKPPTTSPNACGGGAFSADQHYQLVKPHSDEDIKALNEQIKAFLSSCKPSLPLVKPPAPR